MTVMNLDKLEVWVRAKDFAPSVDKEVIPNLPADEKWNLSQQLKRAAQSIPANIAEGHGRYHFLDKDVPAGYNVREDPDLYLVDYPDEVGL